MTDLRKYVVSGFPPTRNATADPPKPSAKAGSRTLAERLEGADPFAEEGPLSDLDAQRMRRAINDAARERTAARAFVWKPSLAALTLVVAASAVFGIARWREPGTDTPAAVTREPPHATGEPKRQVHFVAPGGTRVIWIFNPDFKP